MVVHTCNPCTLETNAEGLVSSGKPELYNEFGASLSYIAKPHLKKQTRKRNFQTQKIQRLCPRSEHQLRDTDASKNIQKENLIP
jgi:hypothetical protein